MEEKHCKLRVLELRPHQVLDGQLFKLKTNWTLRITLAPSLGAQPVRFFTDFPAKGHVYKRSHMRELVWQHKGSHEPRWDPDRYIDIKLDIAGAFKYTYTTLDQDDEEGRGYVLVSPDLGYTPESISCETYVTKLLGKVSEWLPRLEVAHRSGYNMVHFTPVQQLGASQSSYSISNQLILDPAYLPADHTHSEVSVTFTTRSGESKTLVVDSGMKAVSAVLKHLRQQWGVLSLVDVVWNHTSFDSPWLVKHPDSYYNLVNSPHLRPAYVLDVALHKFSRQIANGDWTDSGLHGHIRSEHDIQMVRHCLLDTVLPRLKLWEYFSVDVDAIVKEFRTSVYKINGGGHDRPDGKHLAIIQDRQYRRLGSTVDATLTMELYNIHCSGSTCFESRIEQCCAILREDLCRLNDDVYRRVQGQLEGAVNSLSDYIRYQFLEHHGPRRDHITTDQSLFPRYFYVVNGDGSLTRDEVETSKGQLVAAHNGWVMNADPLKNFALEDSQVYFQRELIVWEDSIKLRYGSSALDSPWLWNHMKRYTQTMAWLFDGFRLDNCHNTPINVAERLLDAAREVKPNLYLVAELFTSSEETDNYFVNRLGINSLVREAMSAPNARELGRLVYKYGGVPVASFFSGTSLSPCVTDAMFIDATHDNEPGHILNRSVQDALPNTALTAIASCASGSCRGYDELVPHRVHIVEETRLYTKWCHTPSSPNEISSGCGIIAAKAMLNKLHKDLAEQGFNQIYVDQVTEEIVAVTRHCPATHRSYIMMAHTAFWPPPSHATPTEQAPNTHYSHVPPLTIHGSITEIYMEARVIEISSKQQFVRRPDFINGLMTHKLDMSTHIPVDQSKMCSLGHNGSTPEIVFNDFPPGSVIVFEVDLLPEVCRAVQLVRSFIGRESSSSEGAQLWSKLSSLATSLSLSDLNYALYRCDSEEQDDGHGGGVYVVPGGGAMTYCGLQGVVSMLNPIRVTNDLGHPLCDNLRSGDWLIGYVVNRLKHCPGTLQISDVLTDVFNKVSLLPRYLIPAYYEAVLSRVYNELVSVSLTKMSKFIQQGSNLVQKLGMGSLQLHGECRSAVLPASLPGHDISGSLAAGLPHFATGFMRCWGRDTFIALRGLLLVTGLHNNARNAILSFGACLRHGLIPNLLNSGAPRYNCRDAVWWWLQSIQDYCHFVSHGNDILLASVRRLFLSDEAEADHGHSQRTTLAELMQEALQRHYDGISFRERGAGSQLDRDMTPPGFNVACGINHDTGFVYGGSQWNCGTWMDKVGESSWAGNKGVPATPRDGSAVELVGLCYSAVSWLASLHKQGNYPYAGVKTTGGSLSFSDWAARIKDNFERYFWIPSDKSQDNDQIDEGCVHRRSIYKDTVGSHHHYTDYQLRPNFTIAIVVAPDLFTPANAWAALQQTESLLKGPMGMKTLDPGDWQYNGFYMNSVDSSNRMTARGFNYHQGPEWLWVTGYYLRARLIIAKRCPNVSVDDVVTSIHSSLSAHATALSESSWNGLPELTNKNGMDCADSCPVQAWSMACLLDVLYDLVN